MEKNSMSLRIARRQAEIRGARTRGPSYPRSTVAADTVGIEAVGPSELRSKRSRASSSAATTGVATVHIEKKVVIEAPVAPSSPRLEPSVIHNQPPGAATPFFRAAVCLRDLNHFRSIPVDIQEQAYHTSVVQTVTIFESLMSKTRESMERTAVLEQTHKEDQSKLSLLEQEMSQMRLTVEEERAASKRQVDELVNQNRSLERQKHRAARQAVRDFRQSEAGESWVEDRAIDWFFKGFTRCQAQFEDSDKFSPKTDLSFLDMKREMPSEFPVPPFNPGPFSDDEEED